MLDMECIPNRRVVILTAICAALAFLSYSAPARGDLVKCRNDRGQIEYRNVAPDDPSCKVLIKGSVTAPARVLARQVPQIGTHRDQVASMWGQPMKITYRVVPEGRAEAWVYEDGTVFGFRQDTLVFIEGKK